MKPIATWALAGFVAATLAAVYALNCLLARRWKPVDWRQALVHFLGMALIGLSGEIAVGDVYSHLFGSNLWDYQVLPIHYAHTSQYALFLWGVYGVHLYLLHGTLQGKGRLSLHRMAIIFALEAIALEAAVNAGFKLVFGRFIFYYFPADLWHLTSVQTLPFYLAAGYVIVYTLRKFEKDPLFFSSVSAALVLVLAFG